MAFKLTNFSALKYTNGFTEWHYRPKDDSSRAIKSFGYFQPALALINGGDRIIISDNTVFIDGFFFIMSNEVKLKVICEHYA